MELNVVALKVTFPLVGLLSGPQSTAVYRRHNSHLTVTRIFCSSAYAGRQVLRQTNSHQFGIIEYYSLGMLQWHFQWDLAAWFLLQSNLQEVGINHYSDFQQDYIQGNICTWPKSQPLWHHPQSPSHCQVRITLDNSMLIVGKQKKRVMQELERYMSIKTNDCK